MDKVKLSIFFVVALLIVGSVIGGSVMTYVIIAEKKRQAEDRQSPATAAEVAMAEPAVNRFCGNCHPTPSPGSFPKDRWAQEVERGFELYFASGRTDLEVPNAQDVLSYYRYHAPTMDEYYAGLPQAQAELTDAPFAQPAANLGSLAAENSASHLAWTPLQADSATQLLVCDMASGVVGTFPIAAPGVSSELQVLAQLRHPAHMEVCDLDGDGLSDLLVADLGSVGATDDLCGSIEWLRATGDGSSYEQITIAEELGRTCDVRPADFDNDGDLDIVAAEFGWQRTGRTLLFLQQQDESGKPNFEMRVVDSRHGNVAVAPLDLNADGLQDFVALISQEYESLDAFINQGDGQFSIENLYRGPEPSYGSSHFQFSDLDQDGDQDIIYVNGDSFDTDLVKPYHSVQWLENEGDLKFTHHAIARQPGVHRALPGDVDGDGDIDLIGVSFMPNGVKIDRDRVQYDSVLWLENQGDETFERRTLEAGDYIHPAGTLGDFDGDGDLDLAVGNVGRYSLAGEVPLVKVWWNESEASR